MLYLAFCIKKTRKEKVRKAYDVGEEIDSLLVFFLCSAKIEFQLLSPLGVFALQAGREKRELEVNFTQKRKKREKERELLKELMYTAKFLSMKVFFILHISECIITPYYTMKRYC